MMSKELLVIGSMGEKSSINFVLSIKTIVNGVCREQSIVPFKTWFHRYKGGGFPRKKGELFVSSMKEYNAALDKFTFPPIKTIKHASPCILENCLSEVIDRSCENNSPLKRFVTLKKDIFTPRIIPGNLETLAYHIDYAEIKESIISFLIQKGEKELAAELRDEFKDIKPNAKDSNTLINRKVKELLSLDLSKYAASISGKKGLGGKTR
jgi:hypothetical protein